MKNPCYPPIISTKAHQGDPYAKFGILSTAQFPPNSIVSFCFIAWYRFRLSSDKPNGAMLLGAFLRCCGCFDLALFLLLHDFGC